MLHLHTSKGLKQVVTDIHITKQYVTMSDPISYMPWLKDNEWQSDLYYCEMCSEFMTEEHHTFCDICDKCRDEYPEL